MDEKDYEFCHEYEEKLYLFNMLSTLHDELTKSGLESYKKIKDYLLKNIDRYMELTNGS